MNTKDYEELLATAAKYDPAPAAKKAAPAVKKAAKKSTTSGSGRRRPVPEPVPEPVPDTPIPLGESLGQLPGVQELERGQAGELTSVAKAKGGGKLKADIDRAYALDETARTAGGLIGMGGDYDSVDRQAKRVDELIEKYGVDLPAYLKHGRGKSTSSAVRQHKAQYLGQAMQKEKARNKKIYTGAIARTKALELVTGGDSSRVHELKKLVDDARDGTNVLNASIANFNMLPEYDTPEAREKLSELVQTIVEAEPKKSLSAEGFGARGDLTKEILDEINPFFRF